MNRLLLFVHFNPHGALEKHVVYTISQLRPIFKKIIFISNSKLSQKDQDVLDRMIDQKIFRSNKGFDFSAFHDYFIDGGWSETEDFDSVTVMNDTCFGPLTDLAPIYERMEKLNIDFWGNSLHLADKSGMPGSNKAVPAHIQSYFMVFNRSVVSSGVFRAFWDGVKPLTNVNLVIQNYETQLTDKLAAKGFRFRELIKGENSSQPNIMITNPEQALINGSPWLKIKAFNQPNAIPQRLIDFLRLRTDYPVEYIYDFFSNNPLRPTMDIQLFNRVIPNKAINAQDFSSVKIAICIHAYYTDVFDRYLDYFNNLNFGFDLFISTNTKEKVDIIKRLAKNKGQKIHAIDITPNYGRDILPWLHFAHELENYDIIGKFHTKKSTGTDFIAGNSWQNDLWQSLLARPDNIISAFVNNPKLGIVIPDIPNHFRYTPVTYITETKLKPIMNKVWNQTSRGKYDFSEDSVFIFPYGNMFWYRPDALKPLTNMKLQEKDVPREPLKADVITILHAIERLPVYVARDRGYLYAISQNKNMSSVFIENISYNRSFHEAATGGISLALREFYRRANNSPKTRNLMKPVRFAVKLSKKVLQ